MRWIVKAGLQKAIGHLPRAEAVNYVLQRKVTRRLPVGDVAFRRKFARAVKHFDVFLDHVPAASRADALFYEFGTGWDLIIPLAYYSLGAERQILVDIRSNLHFELVNDTLSRMEARRAELEEIAGRELRPVGAPNVDALADLTDRFGITYLAPLDAAQSGLGEASVDFVSSTNTLEHVAGAELLPILVECRRLLKPNGVMSCRIDLQDHYSYADGTISPYNFLKFSDRAWRLVNSPLHHQNRLRYPQYLRLFASAGLEVVAEEVVRPTAGDLDRLRDLELAPGFRDVYSLEEVGVKAMSIVARPRTASAPRPKRSARNDIGAAS